MVFPLCRQESKDTVGEFPSKDIVGEFTAKGEPHILCMLGSLRGNSHYNVEQRQILSCYNIPYIEKDWRYFGGSFLHCDLQLALQLGDMLGLLRPSCLTWPELVKSWGL